ncbi:MAG TPA: hypothetical protein VE224_04275 [Pseudolabrys sp.]|nr:hypothetical protein [Pseudolabrys sp.]
MRIVTLMLAAALTASAAAVLAQQPPPLLAPTAPPSPDSRWSFRRVDDGFVRLDNRTGQVAHCTPVRPGWTCQSVPENRSSLEKQVERLQQEVAALKQEVAAMRTAAPPPPPQPQPPPPQNEPSVSLRMPTRHDLDSARDYLTGAWHHLVRMIMQFQHDVLQNG